MNVITEFVITFTEEWYFGSCAALGLLRRARLLSILRSSSLPGVRTCKGPRVLRDGSAKTTFAMGRFNQWHLFCVRVRVRMCVFPCVREFFG
eukprot:3882598-Amphidinium_carterae.1